MDRMCIAGFVSFLHCPVELLRTQTAACRKPSALMSHGLGGQGLSMKQMAELAPGANETDSLGGRRASQDLGGHWQCNGVSEG